MFHTHAQPQHVVFEYFCSTLKQELGSIPLLYGVLYRYRGIKICHLKSNQLMKAFKTQTSPLLSEIPDLIKLIEHTVNVGNVLSFTCKHF